MGNLVPLADNRPGSGTLEDDLLNRHSHRPGMLLNIDELITLAHFPDEQVQSPRLRVDSGRTRPAPPDADRGGLFLGWNEQSLPNRGGRQNGRLCEWAASTDS